MGIRTCETAASKYASRCLHARECVIAPLNAARHPPPARRPSGSDPVNFRVHHRAPSRRAPCDAADHDQRRRRGTASPPRCRARQLACLASLGAHPPQPP